MSDGVVDVDGVEVAGLSSRLDHVRAGRGERGAERGVLTLERVDVGRRAPAEPPPGVDVLFDRSPDEDSHASAGRRQRLEVADQLLAASHEHAALERARRDAALHVLDELPVLLADLVVEREELGDPLVVDVRAEEVVEEAVRPVGRERDDRADREVRLAAEDVDPEVRPEEVELRARQLVVWRRACRSMPRCVERFPSVERRYASGETSTTSLKPGCATWQW